ncbi:MAG: hypothetical protein QOE01_881 [Actinomycetota bacterium]|jgi:diguanylate cyclase (GGDEF)-like protein|nr:hypothetical protein [Actinomycetota bacterium]
MGQAVSGARLRERRRLAAYVACCTAAALTLCLAAVHGLSSAEIRGLGPAFWLITALVLLGELRPVVASGAYDPEGVTLSAGFLFAVMFLWGLWPTVLVQLLAMALGESLRRKPAWKVVFNSSQHVLSLSVAWAVARLLGLDGSPSHPLVMSASDLSVMVLAWTCYFFANLAFVAVALSIRNGTTFWQELIDDIGYYAVTTFPVLVLSPVVVVVAMTVWQLIPLLLLPLFLVYKTASISRDKEYAALHDGLTGLANRKLLTETTDDALVEAAQAGRPIAFCLLDLDSFKEINDTLGHQTGDRLLEIVGTRLANSVRPGDVVARLGGDEFAVLLTSVSDVADTMDAANRLRAVIAEPFHLDGMLLQVDTSVGVSLFPEHGDAVPQLLRLADVAMYQAKREHTGVELYNPARDVHTLDRLGLLGELRRAIDQGELEMHYQPKVSLPGREVVGVEALVRWRHPERGLLFPDEFLDLAEQSGLMRPFTQEVLAQSLSRAAQWWHQGTPLQVSVNVNIRDLTDVGFVEGIRDLLAAHRLPASALQLEITERLLMADPGRMSQALEALGRLGVDLSLDDFGTGYSSLVHLKRLPVSEIKVDRSFVNRMTRDADDAAIVRSIVELGQAFGLRVVAEGVEDEATWQALDELGCDLVQGWLVSRALDGDDLLPWLLRFSSLLEPPPFDAEEQVAGAGSR